MRKMFFLLFGFCFTIPILAKACMFLDTFDNSVQKHNVIFVGTVKQCVKSEGEEYLLFSVENSLIGKETLEYKYFTKCKNSFFKRQKKYLIYANLEKEYGGIIPSYGVSSCSRTNELDSFFKYIYQQIKSYFYDESDFLNHVYNDIEKLKYKKDKNLK